MKMMTIVVVAIRKYYCFLNKQDELENAGTKTAFQKTNY